MCKIMNLSETSRLQDTSVARPSRTEKFLEIMLAAILGFGIGLGVVYMAISRGKYIIRSAHMSSNDTCFTPECITAASNLLHSMDLTQDPCEDFHAFVCGRWIKNSYPSGDLESQFTRLNSIIDLRIKAIMDNNSKNISKHEQKVKDFYNTCMKSENHGSKILSKDLETLGGWPLLDSNWDASDFDWSDTMTQLFQSGYPSDMLMTITISLDIKNTSRSFILVDQPRLGMSESFHFILSDDKNALLYKKLILEIAKFLAPDLNEKDAKEDIQRAFKIEKRLAKAMQAKTTDPKSFYNIKNLSEMEIFAPNIPWKKILEKILPTNEKLRSDDQFMVMNPRVLKELSELLEDLDYDEGKKSLANYMIYRSILFAAPYLEDDLALINQDKMHPGIHYGKWELCINALKSFFDISLTTSYAQQYMNAETRDKLDTMLQDIKASLISSVKTTKWLDSETKSKALLKVKKMKSAIGYHSEIMNSELLNKYYKSVTITEEHFSNVKSWLRFEMHERMKGLHTRRLRFNWKRSSRMLIANAFYQPTENAIVIPVGLIHDTIFSAGVPNYVNYGSLGFILAHEFTHAFDTSGSLYDEEGNYKKWWTDRSWSNFRKKTQCYIKQYDRYYEEHVDSFVNGTITLKENIADNGGILAAYIAYNKLVNRTGKEKKLPGLAFTEKQMFWISFASVWCRKQSNASLLRTVESSLHTLSKFRIIGTLSNIKEFSEDFQCSSSSVMNPAHKCTLWDNGD